MRIFNLMKNKISALPVVVRYKIGRLRLTKSERKQIDEMARKTVDKLEEKILSKFIDKYHWNKQQQEDFKKGFRKTKRGNIAVFKMWFSLAMRLNKLGKKIEIDNIEDKVISEMESKGIFNHDDDKEVLKHINELQKEYKREATNFYNSNKRFIGRIDEFEGDSK